MLALFACSFASCSHYGGRRWLDDRFSGVPPQPPPSTPAPAPEPTFALDPNPLRQSSTSWHLPKEIKHPLVITAAAVSAAAIVFKLYSRWKRDPEHPQLKKRRRLTNQFDLFEKGRPSLSSSPPPPASQHSWLWRLFFSEPVPAAKPARGRHSRGSVRPERSLSPVQSPSPPPKRSFMSAIFSSSSSSSAVPAVDPLSRPLSQSPSLAQPSGLNGIGSDAFRAFLLEVRGLADVGIVIADPTNFYLKRERMRESNVLAMRQSPSGCEANVHILASFDHTLTTLREAPAETSASDADSPSPPAVCLTAQTILDAHLPAAYGDASRKLLQQYGPLETSQHVSAAAKEQYARECCLKLQSLLSLDEYKLTRNRISSMVRTTLEQGRMRMRPCVQSLLLAPATQEEAATLGQFDALCARFAVPVVIFSGAVHDVVEEALLCHDIRLRNTNRADLSDEERERCALSGIHLLANPLRWGSKAPAALHRTASPHASPSSTPLPLAARLHSALSSASALQPSGLMGSGSVCLGFDTRFLVHSLNRTYARVLEQPSLLRLVAPKPHVILLGSSLQDAAMTDGIEQRAHAITLMEQEDAQKREAAAFGAPHDFNLDQTSASYLQQQQAAYHASVAAHCAPLASAAAVGEVLRIGFLNESPAPADKLAAFSRAFDVVVCGDADAAFVAYTLAYVCGMDTREMATQITRRTRTQ